jgi:hypothetical protein
MDEERMVVRQNLKGSYEKVNQVVSVEQIYGHKKRFAKYTWMKNREIHPDIVLPLDTQKNINWQI